MLIGDATCSMERFDKYPNAHWLGFRPYDQIPGYGSGFDVALMPWLDNDWIRLCNPIKMKEYLALGLPVVSTPFPELAQYPGLISVATDRADFVAKVRQVLEGGDPAGPAARRAAVLGASWENRAHQLMMHAEGGA